MRTKQPIRAKRDHFMRRDSQESDFLGHTPVLTTQKQAPEAQPQAAEAQPKANLVKPLGNETASPKLSPTSILSPVTDPPPLMELPDAATKPGLTKSSLPSASVWGGSQAPNAAGTSKHEHEVATKGAKEPFFTPSDQARPFLFSDQARPFLFSAVPEQRVFDGRPFPLTLAPAVDRQQPLANWAAAHRDELLELVEEYDAVLLRGFPGSATAADFSSFVQALRLAPFAIGCSAAPRTQVTVYTMAVTVGDRGCNRR